MVVNIGGAVMSELLTLKGHPTFCNFCFVFCITVSSIELSSALEMLQNTFPIHGAVL